jgi:hypothetical protein
MSVMKHSQARQSDGSSVRRRSLLHGSLRGRITELSVHPLAVVELDVLEEKPSEALLVERH